MRLKSRRALIEYAEFHKLSGRALAKKAGLKPAIVGHLMGGRRHSCSLATARAIEEALGCPAGWLFDAKMSPVADSSRQAEKVPA